MMRTCVPVSQSPREFVPFLLRKSDCEINGVYGVCEVAKEILECSVWDTEGQSQSACVCVRRIMISVNLALVLASDRAHAADNN